MSKLSDWIEANKDDPDNEHNVRNYTMNKEYYEREFAKAEAEGNVVICQYCGYPERPDSSMEGLAFIEHQCCFHCWFWLHHTGLKDGPTKRSIIVNGTHYVDAGNKPKEKSTFLGFGGSKFYYRKIGESEYVETNNMWHQGKIPKRFNIPDTHEFKPYGPPKVEKQGTEAPWD